MLVDYYSKFIETSMMANKTAPTVIIHLKSIFARHGIPEQLISDNMPFNSTEFKKFAKDWGFQTITSSPRYPQSNGMSEKAVQTVKRILKKAKDPYIALLEYRNTPVTGMTYSPSQLLMNRTIRTKLPTAREELHPKLPVNVREQLEKRQKQQAFFYNKNAKPLPSLHVNEGVRLRDTDKKQWIPAKVTAEAETPRSYIVTTESGRQYRRNRRFLLKTSEPPEDTQDVDIPDTLTAGGTKPPEVRRSKRNVTLPRKFQDYVMS